MGHAQSLVIGIRPGTLRLRLHLRLQALCCQSALFMLLIPHSVSRPTTPYASLTLPRKVQLRQQGLGLPSMRGLWVVTSQNTVADGRYQTRAHRQRSRPTKYSCNLA